MSIQIQGLPKCQLFLSTVEKKAQTQMTQTKEKYADLKISGWIKSWAIHCGEVNLMFLPQNGGIHATLTKNKISEKIPLQRIHGIPQQLRDPIALKLFFVNTYLIVNQSENETFSIHVHQKGLGGMFSPKSWGSGAATFFGRESVYTAGAAMGHSNLHVAATQGWDDDVQRFITDGADINRVNPKGNTPLDDAIRERNTSTEAILRENGAKRSNEL